MMETTFAKIIAKHGVTAASVAKGLNLNKATISRWTRVPPERVIDVERITGISRHELRPDLSGIFLEAGESGQGQAA